MPDSTYEAACRCPKCKLPGEVVSKVPAKGSTRPGSTLHTVFCRNDKCVWHNTTWLVQVHPDGTVREYDHRGEPKVYEGFEGHDEAAERLMASLQRQQEAETKPGAEIRNPGTPHR